MASKNEKRPLTLSSPGTPEQPSPRTAQAEDNVLVGGCKFHLRASAWHKPGTPCLVGPKGSAAVEHFPVELVYCESLTQRLYTSMQVFALRNFNLACEAQRKLRLFNHIGFGRLWKSTCTL